MKEMNANERKENLPHEYVYLGGEHFFHICTSQKDCETHHRCWGTENNNADIGDLLKVVFVPDYNVSVAELLIPAIELPQHISSAGMEASGTSNMKFSMNGCILIGTLDGANVKIRKEVGEDNFLLVLEPMR